MCDGCVTEVLLSASSLQFSLPGERGEPHRGQQAASQAAVGGQEGEEAALEADLSPAGAPPKP